MGRPLGPSGGRDPGGGGTGLPEGLRGGRGARERSGAAGAPGAAVSAGAWAAAGASAAVVDWAAGAGAADGPSDGGADGGAADGAGAGAAAAGAGAGRVVGGADWAGRAAAGAEAGAAAAGAGAGRLLLIRRGERAPRSLGGRCRHRTGRRLLDRSAARGRAARYRRERSLRRRLAGTALVPAPGGSSGLGGLGGLARLLGGSGLVGLDRAAQALGVGLAADAVGLGVLNGGRVALDPDPEGKGQLQPLLVGEAELFGQLIDADLLRQVVLFVLDLSRGKASTQPPILAHQVRGAPTPHPGVHTTAAGSRRRWTPRRPVQSRAGAPLRPGSPGSPGTARHPAPLHAGPPTGPRPEAGRFGSAGRPAGRSGNRHRSVSALCLGLF